MVVHVPFLSKPAFMTAISSLRVTCYCSDTRVCTRVHLYTLNQSTEKNDVGVTPLCGNQKTSFGSLVLEDRCSRWPLVHVVSRLADPTIAVQKYTRLLMLIPM